MFFSFSWPLWPFFVISGDQTQQRRWKSQKTCWSKASLPKIFSFFCTISVLDLGLNRYSSRAQPTLAAIWRVMFFDRSRRPFSLRFIGFFRFSNSKSIVRKLYSVRKNWQKNTEHMQKCLTWHGRVYWQAKVNHRCQYIKCVRINIIIAQLISYLTLCYFFVLYSRFFRILLFRVAFSRGIITVERSTNPNGFAHLPEK